MAKASDVVSKAVSSLTAQLKEIKQADEEDLGKLSGLFDGVAQRADEVANVLASADEALGSRGEQKDDKPDKDENGK